MRQVLTHRLRFAPLADLIYATRNQRPLSVQYNVEFNVFVELWRFDVPFAPPNLLILLESLGSNPTLSAITFVIWCLQDGDTYTDTKSVGVADEPRSQSHQEDPDPARNAVLS